VDLHWVKLFLLSSQGKSFFYEENSSNLVLEESLHEALDCTMPLINAIEHYNLDEAPFITRSFRGLVS
jgi:hypothetical protein